MRGATRRALVRSSSAMPLRALMSAVLVLLLAPSAAGAAVPRSAARAVLAACERGDEEADRAAVFEGQMRRLAGAARMQMRFTLQARPPDPLRWRAVAAPGFGTWVSSALGTSRYVYTKRVEALLAPATYRVQLRFPGLDGKAGGSAAARLPGGGRKRPRPRRPPPVLARLQAARPAAQPGRDVAERPARGQGRPP